ncbi:hypothetical protein [Helicobacter cetorum]|uniref:hypothetical protein n=1 Tax=Helicobacter cetorum TaxID=138563 RepID=UPI0013053522|nr:hypothetical protein [Helicobacter cetorum]
MADKFYISKVVTTLLLLSYYTIDATFNHLIRHRTAYFHNTNKTLHLQLSTLLYISS